MCWFLTADFRASAATGNAGRHPPPTFLPCVLPIAPVSFSTVGTLQKWCSVMEGDYLREHHLLLLEPTPFRNTVHTSCCLWSQRCNLILASLFFYLRSLSPRCAWGFRMHQICSSYLFPVWKSWCSADASKLEAALCSMGTKFFYYELLQG